MVAGPVDVHVTVPVSALVAVLTPAVIQLVAVASSAPQVKLQVAASQLLALYQCVSTKE